jgi:hypothetical protein
MDGISKDAEVSVKLRSIGLGFQPNTKFLLRLTENIDRGRWAISRIVGTGYV